MASGRPRARGPRGPCRLLPALAGAVIALAGCATRTAAPPVPVPVPAPAASRPAPSPSPAPAPAAATPARPPAATVATATTAAPTLPPPVAARSWDEFKLNAGRRLVAAHPAGSYMSTPPDILFGIPVIETELNADGTVKSIGVLRRPSDPAAADTVQLAVEAIRRAAPYGDMARLSRPWRWVEVFLFNDQRQFKPRSLD